MFFQNLRYMFHSSIKLRNFLALSGFLLLSIAIMSAIFIKQMENYLIKDLKIHARMSNTSIITAAEKAIVENDFDLLQELVKRIEINYENVRTLTIFDFNWTIIASSNTEKFPLFSFLDEKKHRKIFELSTETREERYVLDEKKNLLRSIKYIYLNPSYGEGTSSNYFYSEHPNRDLLGYIYLELSSQSVVQSFHSILVFSGLLAVSLLIIGFLIAYRLSTFITRRIQILADTVREIALGNLDFSIKPLSNDEISGLVTDVENMRLSIKDLTENLEEKVKQRTKQLEETNKELESFAYSVSHDLREPLRSIKGFSQALIEDFGNSLDDLGKDYLNRIHQASERLTDLINDILRLSRISRGDMYIDNVNLSELSRTICEDLEKQYPDTRFKINIQDDIQAKGDTRFIRLALENLFSNAMKYSAKKETPQIDFGATDVDEVTTFFVKDNGAGFDMTQAYRLFMPFQRLHSDEHYQGSGIGLATVQRIVHRHGGSIWAKSEPGIGSIFYFTL